MSLTISEPQSTKFLDRFEKLRAALRRSQVAIGLGWTVLAGTLAFGALVVADYWLELNWNSRSVGLGTVALLALVALVSRVLLPIRWWSQPRTAAEIERMFPQLGQRIRTVVQYGRLTDEVIDEEGVAPSLVGALEDETETQARPLQLDRVLPRRRVVTLAVLAALPLLALAIAALSDREWRVAISRSLLGRQAYTMLSVAPGNKLVEQGDRVEFSALISGRSRKDVVLYTRPIDRPEEPWTSNPMRMKDGERKAGEAVPRVAAIDKVNTPLAYRIVAGPASSPIYKIDVRYPLAIKAFDVGLIPPAYTAVAPSTVKGGDFTAIEGTAASFRITFDTPPAEASLVLTDPSARAKKGEHAPEPIVLPLSFDGKTHTAGLTLAKSGYYRIDAKTTDGRNLPKNRYRIDVHEDRPPRVSFEEPDEALEVHPIAEIMTRVRAGDDFGLTKAGIVFRFNDGDDQTLLARDFAPGPDGKPTTTAKLEEMLLLEKLKATATDSVTYYAFAEDNYPSAARRTETDLRYLDIRPFKREYKLVEDMPGDDNGGESTTLNELIARQRFNLNRGVRLARHKPTDKTPEEDLLKIATFEESLAGLVRGFTEGLEGIAGQRVEPLHQAEEAMLATVEAIDRGQFKEAPERMSEALRHLIEVRRTFQVAISDGGAKAAAMRSFDRQQTQKIRKPKGKDQEAEAIAEELEKLAEDEDFVYATLNGLAMNEETQTKAEQPGPAQGESPETKDAEKKDEEPKEETKKDAAEKTELKKKQMAKSKSKGQGGQGGQGSKGESGDKPKDGMPGGDPEKGEGKDTRNPKGRREATEKQEQIAADARSLEERLKRLDAASDLAKTRMEKAAEAAEKAASALARGSTKEGTDAARAGALMLHELAKQVKGEISREVADELAMARDLADELSRREDEFARTPQSGSDPGQPGEENEGGKGGPNDSGKGEMPSDSEKGSSDKGSKGEPGGEDGFGDRPGRSAFGDWNGLTEAERVERLEEAARTLQEWMKGAAKNAEGKAAEQVRELMTDGPAAEIVEKAERVGTLYLGGQKPESRKEAAELARRLEILSRQLDLLHRGMVAPELAKLVEFDGRVAELIARLKDVKTDAQITEWHRLASALVRDMEKAGLGDAAAGLDEIMRGASARLGGAWHWTNGPDGHLVAPAIYEKGLTGVVARLQDRLQEIVLKDIASGRDESTPPAFRELVERYYEVLSTQSGGKARRD